MMKFHTLAEAKEAYRAKREDSNTNLEELIDLRDLIRDMEAQSRSFMKLINSI